MVITLNKVVLLSQNISEFRIIDSTKFYNKIDEFINSGDIEFTVSACNVQYDDQEELYLILNHLNKSITPKGYTYDGHSVITYYPENEFINKGTDKKLTEKYFLLRKNGIEDNYSTNILILGNRIKWDF